MAFRKCISVRKTKDDRCVCTRYVSTEEWEKLDPSFRKSFKEMCKEVGAKRVGSTVWNNLNSISFLGTFETGGLDMSYEGVQQEKFRRAAQECKGRPLPEFRACMRERLKSLAVSGAELSDIEYPPIEEYEDYSDTGDYGQLTATGIIPSKSEIVSVLISGASAGASFLVFNKLGDILANKVAFFSKGIPGKASLALLKMLVGIVGGKQVYRFNGEAGTGVALGAVVSGVKDIYDAVRAGKEEAAQAGAQAGLNQYEEEEVLLGDTGQVDIEPETAISQVDIEPAEQIGQPDVVESPEYYQIGEFVY